MTAIEVGRLIHKARKFSRSVKRKANCPLIKVGGFVGILSGVVAKCERTASAALAPTTRTSFARRPSHAGKAPESGQQRSPAPWPDAGDHIQIGSQVALRPRLPVKRDGEPMRLVADPLQEEQRRAPRGSAIASSGRARRATPPSWQCRPRSRPSPSCSSAAHAADSRPLPPSINRRSGNGPPASRTRR